MLFQNQPNNHPGAQPLRWITSRRWVDWLAIIVFGYLAYPPLQLIGNGDASWYLALLLVFYLVLIGVYLVRPPPRYAAMGWMERYLPLAVTFAPAAILQVHPDLQPPAAAVITCCFGIALALWGLLYLRGNFSIMVEGRVLVTHGPYRWLRHPIYLGEIITLLGLMWMSPHWITIAGASAIIAGQLWRAWLEERKLHTLFGADYANYCQQSWWFHRQPR
ncbi:MAG: isoprenylcysteine carboxylmethyltransferase family protein [Mariprofundales bacterium]